MLSKTSERTVVHFIDPECLCTQYSLPHIADLEKAWEGRGVNFIPEYANANSLGFPINIPASPAVAVWNSEGLLTYLGPYTSGQYCGEGEDIVQRHLESGDDSQGQWVNQEAVGCFCEWPGVLD